MPYIKNDSIRRAVLILISPMLVAIWLFESVLIPTARDFCQHVRFGARELARSIRDVWQGASDTPSVPPLPGSGKYGQLRGDA